MEDPSLFRFPAEINLRRVVFRPDRRKGFLLFGGELRFPLRLPGDQRILFVAVLRERFLVIVFHQFGGAGEEGFLRLGGIIHPRERERLERGRLEQAEIALIMQVDRL